MKHLHLTCIFSLWVEKVLQIFPALFDLWKVVSALSRCYPRMLMWQDLYTNMSLSISQYRNSFHLTVIWWKIEIKLVRSGIYPIVGRGKFWRINFSSPTDSPDHKPLPQITSSGAKALSLFACAHRQWQGMRHRSIESYRYISWKDEMRHWRSENSWQNVDSELERVYAVETEVNKSQDQQLGWHSEVAFLNTSEPPKKTSELSL